VTCSFSAVTVHVNWRHVATDFCTLRVLMRTFMPEFFICPMTSSRCPGDTMMLTSLPARPGLVQKSVYNIPSYIVLRDCRLCLSSKRTIKRAVTRMEPKHSSLPFNLPSRSPLPDPESRLARGNPPPFLCPFPSSFPPSVRSKPLKYSLATSM